MSSACSYFTFFATLQPSPVCPTPDKVLRSIRARVSDKALRNAYPFLKRTVTGTPAKTGIKTGWTVTYPDEGNESASTWATQLSDYSTYKGYSATSGKLLGAEQNMNCNSTWDCNNIDVQDWQRFDDYYYAIYNGSNYFRCSRPSQSAGNLTNLWALGIRRSKSPLGTYEESTARIHVAERDDVCEIVIRPSPRFRRQPVTRRFSTTPATPPAIRWGIRPRGRDWSGIRLAPLPPRKAASHPGIFSGLSPGRVGTPPNTSGRFDGGYFEIQGDGNLVMYARTPEAPGSVLWNTETGGKCGSPCAAVFQTDGHFVLYGGNSQSPRPAWDSMNQLLTIQLHGCLAPSFLTYELTQLVCHALRSQDSIAWHVPRNAEAGNLVMYINPTPTKDPVATWSAGTLNRCFAGVTGGAFQCALVLRRATQSAVSDVRQRVRILAEQSGGANRTLRLELVSWVSIWTQTAWHGPSCPNDPEATAR